MCAEVVTEALASRKVVFREECTEGSETAKSGTDEQELHMRLSNLRVSKHIITMPQTKRLPTLDSRCSSDQRKGNTLTRGDLCNHELV